MFRPVGYLLALTTLLGTVGSASANYFDGAAHTQAMNDIAATPPWVDEGDYDDEDYYGYDEPPSFTGTEWALWSHDLQLAEAKRQYDAATDPEYRAFMDGEWLFKTPVKGETAQTCSAMFLRQGTGALIIATGGKQDPVLLGFFSLNTPKPTTPGVVEATLKQTGDDPAASVDVYNAPLPWAPEFGLVFFAVPSASLLVDNMLDTHAFSIAMGGKDVAAIEWTGGLKARDELKTCIASRT